MSDLIHMTHQEIAAELGSSREVIHGVGGTIVAVVGLVPLLAGLFDFCVFAPLFGAPMSGPKIRAEK